MIGKGTNKKSMAYVGNIVAFIQSRIEKSAPGYSVYNYADKPDISTQELIEFILHTLGKEKAGIRIPYAVGYAAGLGFDLLAKITHKKLPISSVRIKKFCATTQFAADKVANTGFKAPFSLEDGVNRTIRFIQSEPAADIKES